MSFTAGTALVKVAKIPEELKTTHLWTCFDVHCDAIRSEQFEN